MHGPNMKGFAEMAISKANRTSLPLLVASTATMRVSDGSSSPVLLSRSRENSPETAPEPEQSSLVVEDEAPSVWQRDFSRSANGFAPRVNSDKGFATPNHHSSDLESEDVRRARSVSVVTRQESGISEADFRGRGRSFAGGSREDTVSVASAFSTTSTGECDHWGEVGRPGHVIIT